MAKVALTPRSRTHALEAMSDDVGLDVLVVGGGVTGAGVALDAATRGLRTGIIEAQDWASGTSSRSSKLAHGGLRYLQMLDFALVHEALIERNLLLSELAPHLVHKIPFLYPLKHRVWERFYVGAGVALYDALATASRRRRATPFHRHLTKSKLRQVFPDLREDAAHGAIQYWDARVDDARLVLSLIRSAVDNGALAASRTQLVGLTKNSVGAVDGAEVVDAHRDTRYRIKARRVINATGVWTEETESLTGGEDGLKVLASKGIHLVVPKDRIQGDKGLILQTEKSVLFVIPWPDYWIIGTTDTPYEQDPRHPVVTKDDVDYLLEQTNAVLRTPLTHEDVIGTYAGLRPLLQPATASASTKVSREHTVASPTPGFVVIAGGKLTTYRVMAKDAVDFALGAQAQTNPSITDQVPLSGAEGLRAARVRARRWAKKYGWTKALSDHLVYRYGSNIDELIGLIEQQPDLAKPLAEAPTYLRAEIAHAAHFEMSLHLEDVLLHRTRLHHEAPDRGLAASDEIAQIIAPILGWDDQRISEELSAYSQRCQAEEAAAQEVTDQAAAQMRGNVGDVTPMLSLDT
ncbi:MAG TPA: glycerol-3-phosphate dehydrogenase/oxidase [Beutenbergiaceae bacterium]|nr:glycerol-3-phosphate dehydrogenase/oxidase [Beutenbergiaceae bacterium]